MTQEETAKVLAILKAAYPNSYKGMTKNEAMGTIAVWHTQLHDLPVDIVMMAVQKCIGESTFPPAISEVKKKVQSIHWDAYELLELNSGSMSDRELQMAKRIYDNTKTYRNTIPASPPLLDMIGSSSMNLLIESNE